MPTPIVQRSHAFSAERISCASASSAAWYSRLEYSTRRRTTSPPAASSTATSILVPPTSTPSLMKRLQPGLQPGACRSRVLEPPARDARPVAHLDGVAAHRVHHAEAVFVGDVVADEHRLAPGERRLLHE